MDNWAAVYDGYVSAAKANTGTWTQVPRTFNGNKSALQRGTKLRDKYPGLETRTRGPVLYIRWTQ